MILEVTGPDDLQFHMEASIRDLLRGMNEREMRVLVRMHLAATDIAWEPREPVALFEARLARAPSSPDVERAKRMITYWREATTGPRA